MQAAHASGVDDIVCLCHSPTNTLSAWIIRRRFVAVPIPVLGVGRFSRALLGAEHRRNPKPKAHLFPTQDGSNADVPMNSKTVWNAVHEAAIRAGLGNRVHPHTRNGSLLEGVEPQTDVQDNIQAITRVSSGPACAGIARPDFRLAHKQGLDVHARLQFDDLIAGRTRSSCTAA